MNKKNLAMAVLLLIFTAGFSQENKSVFQPKGKAFLKVFTNYNSNLGGNEQVEAQESMQIKRAYFGYKSSLSENYSVKLTMDVGNNSGKYSAYLKIAELKYKKDKWTVNLGMIATKQFKVQEKFWEYRYLLKSYQDQYKYNSSADLGLSANYQINKNIGVDVIIQNGEGYKNVDPTGTYRAGVGTTIKYKPITFRVYYDISAKTDINRQNIAAFIGYKFKDKFRLGAEYNYQLNNAFVEEHNMFGYSVYSTFIINPKFEIFARYDNTASNIIKEEGSRLDPQAWNANKDAQLSVVGVQYKPLKNISVSANYRRYLSAIKDSEGINWLFLNLEFKF